MDDEKELLIKALEAIAKQMKETGDITGSLGRTMSEAEKKLKKLETQYASAAKGIDELDKSIKDGSENVLNSLGSFKAFQTQLARSGKAIDAETEARINSIRKAAVQGALMKGFLDVTQEGFKAATDLAIGSMKTMVSQLQGTGDAFTLMTSLATQTIDAQNKANQAISSGGVELGTVLTIVLPGYFKILGVAIMAAAKFFGYVSEKASDVAKFGFEKINAEIQKTIKSFNEASKAGMFFTNGMSQLTELARETGVSYRDMIGALKGVNVDLAQLGGNAGAGALQVAKTFKAMEPFRKGLLNLGISTEEQIQGAAEYMAILARSGQLEGKTSADLAKGSDAYLTNLKVITSITGEEAKAAQSRARKASEQFAVQNTLTKLGGESAIKFQNAVKQMPQGASTAIQQMLEFGTVTNTDLAAAIHQVPGFMNILQQYTDDIKDGSISSTEALEKYNKALADPALLKQLDAAAQGYGKANTALGLYGQGAELLGDFQRQALQAQKKGLVEAGATVKGQKETTDELTNAVSNATVKFQEMQAALETELKPAITKFASFVDATIVEMQAKWAATLSTTLPSSSSATRNPFDTPVPTTAAAAANRTNTEAAAATATSAARESGSVSDRVKAAQALRDAERARMEEATAQHNRARELNGMPAKAEGGVTSGPTLAGENGAEAVIPLKGGRVPLHIDFEPVVSALIANNKLMEDMVRKMDDSKDIQQQILNASY